MQRRTRYAAKYADSWAVIVGINQYQHTSPLGYAVNDATSVAAALGRVGFDADHTAVLVDADATREKILAQLQSLRDRAGADDRVLFFFAGHGLTVPGHRGDIGFLVPVDGVPRNVHSLIRWDDLTRSAELIPAKHAIFIMDACYGGLAVVRDGGGKRFLKDMLSRYVRQVLAAGKPDQTVADSGGPRPGNSVFTGHLLEALDGKAASDDGTLTANGVMAYVYDRVGRDTASMQTPHYGSVDGDGDFVFLAPTLDNLQDEDGIPTDFLVQGPVSAKGQAVPADDSELVSALKAYLAQPSRRIRLDELVMREVRSFLRSTGLDRFPVQGGAMTGVQFATVLQDYEDAARRLMITMTLLGRWCSNHNRTVLRSVTARLADNINTQGGSTMLLGLRWYPAMLASYCGGIGALAGSDYGNLNAILNVPVRDGRTGDRPRPMVLPMVDGILDVHRSNAFKLLPGHERHFAPCSEYLFKQLQPLIEDVLFLGRDYEDCFDRFEVFQALDYADLDANQDRVWGPMGRFAWKFRGQGQGPFADIVAEAKLAGEKWRPLRVGLFQGSSERFSKLTQGLATTMNTLNWH